MARFKSLIKCAAFVLAAILCVSGVLRILVPKNYTGEGQSPVPTYFGFYDLKKNTADILYLGSSHVYTSFSPQVLYDEYGITSYSLAMGNQNLTLSYYWLKEALRTQSPSAVVLECAFAFDRNHNPSNSIETYTQKSVNYMHWSLNRIGAIKALCETDPELYTLQSFIPNIRFHDRWKELHEEDFILGEIASREPFMGASKHFRHYCGVEDYQPYSIADGSRETEGEEMVPVMKEYLDRIVDLCRERNIRLILTFTPCVNTKLSMHVTMREYAKDHGVEFLDFNTEDMFREMDYEFSIDNSDVEHPNMWGAQKITRRFGKYLTKEGDHTGTFLQPHKDEQWENSRSCYEEALKDAELIHTDNIYEYLPALRDDRYSVFICARGQATSELDEELALKLHDLGLRTDLRDLNGESYFAVIDAGRVVEEERSKKELKSTGVIRNGMTFYEIISKGSVVDDLKYGRSSIVISGRECSVNRRGINIAVVDHESAEVIDKVCFHTGGNLKAER